MQTAIQQKISSRERALEQNEHGRRQRSALERFENPSSLSDVFFIWGAAAKTVWSILRGRDGL